MADPFASMRRLQCGLIVPGWVGMTLATWVPQAHKPTKALLQDEVKRRASTTGIEAPKSTANYSVAKLISWLEQHPACPATAEDDRAELEALRVQTAEDSEGTVVRWKAKSHERPH